MFINFSSVVQVPREPVFLDLEPGAGCVEEPLHLRELPPHGD